MGLESSSAYRAEIGTGNSRPEDRRFDMSAVREIVGSIRTSAMLGLVLLIALANGETSLAQEKSQGKKRDTKQERVLTDGIKNETGVTSNTKRKEQFLYVNNDIPDTVKAQIVQRLQQSGAKGQHVESEVCRLPNGSLIAYRADFFPEISPTLPAQVAKFTRENFPHHVQTTAEMELAQYIFQTNPGGALHSTQGGKNPCVELEPEVQFRVWGQVPSTLAAKYVPENGRQLVVAVYMSAENVQKARKLKFQSLE